MDSSSLTSTMVAPPASDPGPLAPRSSIAVQTNAECVALLLHKLLLVTICILFIRCFPSIQTLLSVAFIQIAYKQVLSDISIHISALALSTTRASATLDYVIPAVTQTPADDNCAVSDIKLSQRWMNNDDVLPRHTDKALQPVDDTKASSPESLFQVKLPSPSRSRKITVRLNNNTELVEETPEMARKRQKRVEAKRNVRTRASENKENEFSTTVSTPKSTQATSSTHRSGLKPLTLAVTSPLSRENRGVSGARPNASLLKESKRSSVFYVSDKDKEPSHPTPIDAVSTRNSMSEAFLLDRIEDLAGKLLEERYFVTRLRANLEELESRTRTREHALSACKRQYSDLLAAVEARDFIIRVLCANIGVLQEREVVWKTAAWFNLYQKLSNEVRFAKQGEQAEDQINKLLRHARMTELGHRWIFGRFKEQLKVEMTMPTCIAPPATKDTALDDKGTGANGIRRSSSLDHLFNRLIESVVKCDGPGRNLAPSMPDSGAIGSDDDSQDSSSTGRLGIMSPTIPPRFPSCSAARPAVHDIARSPSTSDDIIYEVDGPALAVRNTDQSYAQPLPPNHVMINGAEWVTHRQDTTQTCIPDSHLLRDSPFYVVAESDFVLPKPISPFAQGLSQV